jgi:hypothetical protein
MGNKMVIVDLVGLNVNSKIYVKLSDSLLNWMVRAAKSRKKYSGFSDRFYRMSRGQKVSLDLVLQISKQLGISSQSIRENIELMTSVKNTNVGIRNPRIPFDFASSDGVRFIAALHGDGYFNKFLQCGYSNQNKEMVLNVLQSAKAIFGDVDSKLYLRKDNTYNLNFPKIVGFILREIGMRPGFKYSSNPAVPEFIFSLDKKLKAIYLKQFFSDEGNVRLKDRRVQVKQTILTVHSKKEIKKNPEKFGSRLLLGCKRLLKDLQIDSVISLGAYRKTDKGIKADWELSVYRIENLLFFSGIVGFEQGYKNELLKQAIKSYKFPSAARNGRIDFALNNCRAVQEKYGFVDKEKLAEQCKRSLKTATYYLIDLKKKGLVKIAEKPKRFDGRFKKFKYVLLEK